MNRLSRTEREPRRVRCPEHDVLQLRSAP